MATESIKRALASAQQVLDTQRAALNADSDQQLCVDVIANLLLWVRDRHGAEAVDQAMDGARSYYDAEVEEAELLAR